MSVVLVMFASRPTLETLRLAFELEDKFLEFLDLEATLLNLDLEVNIMFKSRIDLVWSSLGKLAFFEEMYAELDVEVFFFEGVDVLLLGVRIWSVCEDW
jgi:hypothetical protein